MASASNPSGPEPPKGAGIAVRAPGGGKAKKLLSMGGTFLTVAVLTGLLWVWADQSQLLIQEISLSFVLATEADSSLVLLSVDDGSGEAVPDDTATGGKRITAKVSFGGTRSRLTELQADLQSGQLKLLSYLSEVTYLAGKHSISVVDLLNANDELRDRGLTVMEAEPVYITIELDEWVLIDKIKLALRDTPKSQRFQPRIDPPEIAVQVPSSLEDNLPEELLVELGEIPEKITSEETVSGTVSTELGGLPVRPALSTVTVILQPRKQSDAELGPLPLYAVLPVDMIGKYEVKFEKEADKKVDVKVVGPAGELAKLQMPPQEKVRAYIRLGTKHTILMAGYYTVTVEFEFDDDVHGVKISGPPKRVKVRLEKKPTAP